MSHWTTDAGSIAVLGHTQTGKTVLSKQLHVESNRVSVWVNQRGDERVPDVHGNRYESVDGIVKGMSRNERKFNLLSGDLGRDITQLQKRMWGWAENSNRELPMQLVIDEIHNFAPENAPKEQADSRDAIRKISKEGQKRNIKLIGITQDPVSMDKQTLRQVEYVALFHNHFTQTSSLNRLDIPVAEAQELPEHHFIVIGARGEMVVGPPGMKANSKYA